MRRKNVLKSTIIIMAVGSYIIKEAQIHSNGSVNLTYYVDNDWKEKKKVVFWDK